MGLPINSKRPALRSNLGCLVTVTTLFALGVVAMVFHAVGELSYHDLTGAMVALVAAAVFAAFALFFFWLAYRKAVAKLTEIAAVTDDLRQPWLLNPQWAARRIEYLPTKEAWRAWIFTALFSAVTLFMLFIFFRFFGEWPWRWVVLFLPVIVIVLIVSSIVMTRRAQRFGPSTFELATLPGVIGGELAGKLACPLRPDDLAGSAPGERRAVTLTLACWRFERVYRRSSSSYSSRGGSSGSSSTSIHSQVLWKSVQTFNSIATDPGRGCSLIPVSFQIPRMCQSSSEDTGGENVWIQWQLEARAKLPGPDYVAVFEVPVYPVAAVREKGHL